MIQDKGNFNLDFILTYKKQNYKKHERLQKVSQSVPSN